MAITDLTGTTWRLNDVPVVSTQFQYTIFYTANNVNYAAFVGIPTSPGNYIITYSPPTGSSDPSVAVYNTSNGGWNTTGGADYRTIVVSTDQHGQTGATNSTFIAWLEANAVQVIPPVTVSYNSNTIVTIDTNGTTILDTEGTYLIDDITIEYTRPSLTLQSKSVNPSTTSTQVTADNGYDGLSSVTVAAMPSGSATAPVSISGTSATITTSANTITLSKTISVTPTVSAGYVSTGTAGNSTVSLTASATTKSLVLTNSDDTITTYSVIDIT